MSHNVEKEASRIPTLLARFMVNSLTPQEQEELDRWASANERNQFLFEELTDLNSIELDFDLYNTGCNVTA